MFFEDFAVGQTFTSGTRTVSEAEIVAFAKEWDRQPFHLDAEAARGTIYGGLIASGWHTLVMAFDLVIRENVWNESSSGSPGMDQVRWIKPVRPGDTLQVKFEVVEIRASRTRADRGYVLWDHTVTNQMGQTVCTFRSTGISLRREPQSPGTA